MPKNTAIQNSKWKKTHPLNHQETELKHMLLILRKTVQVKVISGNDKLITNFKFILFCYRFLKNPLSFRKMTETTEEPEVDEEDVKLNTTEKPAVDEEDVQLNTTEKPAVDEEDVQLKASINDSEKEPQLTSL